MGQKRNPFLKKIKFYMATMVGGFKYFLFSSLFGEMIQFDGPHIFQMGWFNHQPDDSGDFFNHFFPPKNCGPWGVDRNCTEDTSTATPFSPMVPWALG